MFLKNCCFPKIVCTCFIANTLILLYKCTRGIDIGINNFKSDKSAFENSLIFITNTYNIVLFLIGVNCHTNNGYTSFIKQSRHISLTMHLNNLNLMLF